MIACAPDSLAQSARCFQCLPSHFAQAVITYLLCQWENGSGAPADLGMGITWTPETNNLMDVAGLFASINSPLSGVTSISIDHTTTNEGYSFTGCATLQSVAFPNLLTLDSNGQLDITSCPALTFVSLPVATSINILGIHVCNALTSVSVPSATNIFQIAIINNNALASISFASLTTVGFDFDLSGNPALTSLSLPVLDSVAGGEFILNGCGLVSFAPPLTQSATIRAEGSTSLTYTSFPNLTPNVQMIFDNCTNLASVGTISNITIPDGAEWRFHACALPSAEVNKILAQWIASGGQTTGIIDTAGGTSGPPTGQGVIDKATLQGNGVTVTTN